MIVFIPLFAFLIYRSIKTKSKAVYSLLVFAIFSFLSYKNIIEQLIYPLPYIVYGIGILSIPLCILFSRREYVKAKKDYLKSRRKKREKEENNKIAADDNHDKIVIEHAGGGEQKVYYVKRSANPEGTDENNENVPHGTSVTKKAEVDKFSEIEEDEIDKEEVGDSTLPVSTKTNEEVEKPDENVE